MKDNFDLKQFLVENKMTEASRGKARQHFSKVVLNENVRIAADEDNEMLDEARIDKDALYREYVGYEQKYGAEKAMKMMQKFHPEVDFDAINIIPRFARKNAQLGAKQDQVRLNSLRNLDRDYRDEDDDEMDETCGMRHSLDEAGYGDEDDNYADDDFDFTAGDSLVNLIGGQNKKAKKAAEKEFGSFDDEDDEPVRDADMDDEDSFEDPEDINTDSVKDMPDLAAGIKFDPETVDLDMDTEELNDYLNNFRRPQVAAKVLQRALNAAQNECDEYGYKKLYLVLNNGFYETRRFVPSGLTKIATVKAHPENLDESLSDIIDAHRGIRNMQGDNPSKNNSIKNASFRKDRREFVKNGHMDQTASPEQQERNYQLNRIKSQNTEDPDKRARKALDTVASRPGFKGKAERWAATRFMK